MKIHPVGTEMFLADRLVLKIIIIIIIVVVVYSTISKLLNFLDRFPKNRKILNIVKVYPVGTDVFHADKLVSKIIIIVIIIVVVYSTISKRLNFLDKFPKNHKVSNIMKIRPVGTDVFHVDRLVLKIIIIVVVVVVCSTISKRGTRWRTWLRH
jgi:hypothetical protein